jgi:DNA (cytosine-5)-methyltransferase 1
MLKPAVGSANPITFAELFSGIGLMRLGLEQTGMQCKFANDLDANKNLIYQHHFGSSHLHTGDIAQLRAAPIPSTNLITASFPCQDLSLAGNRKGLAGERSGLFHEFIRILTELQQEHRAPKIVLLENVSGLLTSHGGQDIRSILESLNNLGYACDLLLLDAVHFLPQSRPRIFIVGNQHQSKQNLATLDHHCHPKSIQNVIQANPHINWQFLSLPKLPASRTCTLEDCLETGNHLRWFNITELTRELAYIRGPSLDRLEQAQMRADTADQSVFLTAYRRMRSGLVCLETRDDGIAGCLRTPGGGSSRQVLIEIRPRVSVRMRYLTAREYGRLQGAPDTFWIPDNQRLGMYAFGDAVAVPVIAWLGMVLQECLRDSSIVRTKIKSSSSQSARL